MQKLLDEIKDGTFANNWIRENKTGRPQFNKTRASEQDHQIEQIGAELRGMMPFLDPVTIKPGQQG
jgi:ketol-acid reductoisomerase